MKPTGSKPLIIEAHKQGWPRSAVDAMIRSKLRGGFHQVLAQGMARIRLELDRDPSGTLFLVNHSCWWDLFFVHLLNETIPVDGYGMMEHFNLVRFGFFRRDRGVQRRPDRPVVGPGVARLCGGLAPTAEGGGLGLPARED